MVRLLLVTLALVACTTESSSAPSDAIASPLSVATPPGATLAATAPARTACIPAQLEGVAAWLEDRDRLIGAVFVGNRGPDGCVVSGIPTVRLVTASGLPLDFRYTFASGTREPRPLWVPVKPLQYDVRGVTAYGARVSIWWIERCLPPPSSRFVLTLPRGGTSIQGGFIDLPGVPHDGARPQCSDAAETPTLVVEPFRAPP